VARDDDEVDNGGPRREKRKRRTKNGLEVVARCRLRWAGRGYLGLARWSELVFVARASPDEKKPERNEAGARCGDDDASCDLERSAPGFFALFLCVFVFFCGSSVVFVGLCMLTLLNMSMRGVCVAKENRDRADKGREQ
jgi:hypothetical protein